jgi:multicomponent Na+:H+ antiporter subunit D
VSPGVLLPLPVVLPLAGAALSLIVARRPYLQRALGLVVLAAGLAVAVVLLVRADQGQVLATQLGGWPAPLGITLAADRLSALLLVTGDAMLLAVLAYAIGQGAEGAQARIFHPVYLVLAAGVSAAFLTGDLFNLFVAFEVMLSASYVLITLGGRAGQVRAGMTYVVTSLLASILFLTALALVYAAAGTVNMADLAGRMPGVAEPVRLALGLLLVVVFGIKAAVFPLFSWLPDAYPTAPAPVTAVFAGLLTKVGIYAIIRTATLILGGPGALPGPVLEIVAVATMLTGALGALIQDELKRVFSFLIISGAGFALLGVAVGGDDGLAAGILYTVHSIVVLTGLFLLAGLIEQDEGSGHLSELEGLAGRLPALAWLFGPAALSVAGFPPFSGFLAKLALVRAGGGVAVAAVLLASLVTVAVVARVWAAVFWRDPEQRGGTPGPQPARSRRVMGVATAVVVGLGLVMAVAGGPLYELSLRAAAQARDPAAYREAVLGGGR